MVSFHLVSLSQAWYRYPIGLDKAQLERKIRLLVLSDLGSKNIGRDVPYSEIASALMIEVEQVETWVIDGEFSLFKISFS